jgi:uncharacterized protein (UPF0332 family)
MSLAGDLLSQAASLATQERGKPKQASLRRAVSTAYYALFHFMTDAACKHLLGAGSAQRPIRELAARAFVHGKMQSLCKEFTKPIPTSELLKPFWQMYQIPACVDMAELASIFCSLQRERHEADYNVGRRITREDAKVACLSAKEAMARWTLVERRNPEIARLFCVSLLLWPSLSSR